MSESILWIFNQSSVEVLTPDVLDRFPQSPKDLQVVCGETSYPVLGITRGSSDGKNFVRVLFGKMRCPPQTSLRLAETVDKSFNFQNTSWTFSWNK
jgi:hypothetical protein